MSRRAESRGRSRRILILLGVAVALIGAPTATGAGTAIEEYTLEVPGAGDTSSGRSGPIGSPDVSAPGAGMGVAGEEEPAPSGLSSVLRTVGDIPALAVLALLTTTWLLLDGPRRRAPEPG